MPADERGNGGGGPAAWARRWWRAVLAEALATALLVWMGLGAVVPLFGPEPLTHPAFAFGCAVVALSMAFGPVSGAHMNPSVTLAALLCGRIELAAAAAYVLAQLAGAVLGFGALLATAPSAGAGSTLGCTLPAPTVSPGAALVIEAALTAVLALACCGAWAAPADATAPLKIGLVVVGLIYTGGHATGASLNPARSLGPALLQKQWTHHWVYWVGPLGGAAIATLLHRHVFSPAPAPAPASAPAPEELPLNDKP